jgi:hypothetical protein
MANTYSSSLLTQVLEEQAVAILSDVLAPVAAFARQFSTDKFKPRAVAQVKFVTGGATTQVDASDFENAATTGSTIANVEIVPSLYTQSFQVSNDDLNSGLRLTDLVTKNCRVFGESLLDVIFAPITESNFSVAVTRTNLAFNWADMQSALGVLKKSPVKTAILDGEYMARISNSPVLYQKAGTESGAGPGWLAFGWSGGIYECSRWSGAGAGVRGFFCGQSALGVLAGLPLLGESVTLQSKTITLPGLQLSVQANQWFSLKSRSMFASFDLVMGVALLDATCGFLLKSA